MPRLLIDGDILLYRCGFAVEKTKYLVDTLGGFVPCDSAKETQEHVGPVWTRKEIEPLENALYLVKSVVEKIQDKYPKLDRQIFLSPSVGNFRETIAVTHKYKGNRDAMQKPKYFRELKDYLVDKYGAIIAVGQEADDELGIGATLCPDSVMVSIDKDLRQVPGRHYDWVKEEEVNVTKKEGIVTFYSQVLSGDPTDNIHGLEGIGPVKGRKMLADCSSSRDCWEVVRNAYQSQEGRDQGRKRALENAQLCWIRRKVNEIWTPPE